MTKHNHLPIHVHDAVFGNLPQWVIEKFDASDLALMPDNVKDAIKTACHIAETDDGDRSFKILYAAVCAENSRRQQLKTNKRMFGK